MLEQRIDDLHLLRVDQRDVQAAVVRLLRAGRGHGCRKILRTRFRARVDRLVVL